MERLQENQHQQEQKEGEVTAEWRRVAFFSVSQSQTHFCQFRQALLGVRYDPLNLT